MSIREERKLQSRQAMIEAALLLCASGRSFSNISLREITRAVGLVPTAFYRHFENMDALGLEIVDQVSLYFKSLVHHLGQIYLNLPEEKLEQCLELFLRSVEQSSNPWIFLITEHWGGSHILRDAISRELIFIIEDLAHDLQKFQTIQHIQKQELIVLSKILLNLSLNWAMTWICYQQQFSGENLKQQQSLFKQQTFTQIKLLFKGISHWHCEKSTHLLPHKQ